MADEKTDSKKKSKTGQLIVGGIVFAVAVASVFLLKKEPVVEEEEVVVRPIKNMVIRSSYGERGLKFPGKVRAGQQVNLAFEVAGSILGTPFPDSGAEVKKGEPLMSLDPRDFQNQFDAAVAERDRAKSLFDRMERALATNAVSRQERDNAKAQFDQAVANLNIRQKALEDANLVAAFDGFVADVFVERFQTVQAKQAVLSLTDLATIDIEVSVPESKMARSEDRQDERIRLVAEFDFFPDDEPYPVEVKEYAAQADPATQTFAVTVTMKRPENRTLLPGMTATVTAYLPKDILGEDADGYPVPLDAVPVDGVGQYYVWKLKDTGNDTFTTHRTDVEVGEITGNEIIIRKGLARGDRIALAGVTVLTEGREVSLLDTRTSPAEAIANPTTDGKVTSKEDGAE